MLLAIAVGCAVALGTLTPLADCAIHDALESLALDRLDEAELRGLELACRRGDTAPHGWLVAAIARERSGRLAAAEEAYKGFLSLCSDERLRTYAAGRIERCRTRRAPPAVRVAPSRALSDARRRALSRVGPERLVESSDHFVVRARNASLARLIAREAERALQRICAELLGARDYPHSVNINVWADPAEYAAHATSSPEWAGGGFSLQVRDGVLHRRIDLTQNDEEGNFSTLMLDRVLPHELCHLVLQEHFGDAPCPLVVNEGLAMLAESEVDESRVLLAGAVLAAERSPDLQGMLSRHRYDLKDPAVFYAKAFSFVEFLHERLTPEQFADFLSHVKDGCAVGDALERSLYVPADGRFLESLTGAWRDRAVTQAQYLRALRSSS